MQYCILFVFIPFLSEGTEDYADAGLYPLLPLASETSDRTLDGEPPSPNTELYQIMSEQDDRDVGDPVLRVVAERDELKDQLAQKSDEYIAQHHKVQKLGILFQQEQEKNRRLQTLLQQTLRKLMTFEHDFDSLARMRSMLDSAVDTAASVSLEASSNVGLDDGIEDVTALTQALTEAVPPTQQQQTGIRTTTATHDHALAQKKELGSHVKLGKGHLRSGRVKMPSPAGSFAGDATAPIPDAEANSILPGSVDLGASAELHALPEDPKIKAEDLEILALEKNLDAGGVDRSNQT